MLIGLMLATAGIVALAVIAARLTRRTTDDTDD